MLNALQIRLYQPTEYLCKQFEVADRLFILLEGEVAVEIENEMGISKQVNTIMCEPADDNIPIFGESSIVDEQEHCRTATLLASTFVKTLEIMKFDYFEMLAAGHLECLSPHTELHKSLLGTRRASSGDVSPPESPLASSPTELSPVFNMHKNLRQRALSHDWSADLSPPTSPVASQQQTPDLWGVEELVIGNAVGSVMGAEAATAELSAERNEEDRSSFQNDLEHGCQNNRDDGKCSKMLSDREVVLYEQQLDDWVQEKLNKWENNSGFRKRRIQRYQTKELFAAALRTKAKQQFITATHSPVEIAVAKVGKRIEKKLKKTVVEIEPVPYEQQLRIWIQEKLGRWDSDAMFRGKRQKKYKTRDIFEKHLFGKIEDLLIK